MGIHRFLWVSNVSNGYLTFQWVSTCQWVSNVSNGYPTCPMGIQRVQWVSDVSNGYVKENLRKTVSDESDSTSIKCPKWSQNFRQRPRNASKGKFENNCLYANQTLKQNDQCRKITKFFTVV
ncbi:hypothetical protein TNCT_231091 [Trichonephila clavata]|uniref:Uncharacterized protein n=1 Tax=Trichonephila clavata TaxID=2740835 RepID=A0A8X6LDA6_TRICU|nr:hypothetical protein TNCT_231091 [Trichonephila clavata]